MSANKKTRQTAKLTGFASGVVFLFGVTYVVGGEKTGAFLAFLCAFFLYGIDIEFTDREEDKR